MSVWNNIRNRYRSWGPALLVVGTLNAILNIGVIVSENLAHHHENEWIFYVINEFTGSYMTILLIPPVVAIFERWPLRKPHIASTLLIYLLASLAFGFTLTSLMYGLRVPLYKLVGIDRLAEIFNDLPWRYLMEYFKQFFVFMLIYFVYRGINEYHKNREREQQEVVLRQELLKAQIQGLQMQLHPHFFFNTLNTISSVMYHNPARADRLISQLSKFLRNVIDLKDQQLHPLEKEIELLQQFTDVMKERYRDQLFVQFDIAETCTAYAVPVLILQPLVENAIKYAIDHQEQTEVRVQAQCEEERLLLEVIDNGPGIREGSLTKGTGLSATIARLQKLYPDQYQFDMQNRTQGGLQISINLPASRSMLVTH